MTKKRMNETRKLFLQTNEGNIYMQDEKSLGKGAGAYNSFFSCYKIAASKYYHFELKGLPKGNRWSTGKTRKPEAILLLDSIIHNAIKQRNSLTFEKFTENFYVPGKCPFLMGIDSDEEEILDSTIKKNRLIMKTRLQPFFNKMEMRQIESGDFKKWKIHVRKHCSHKTMLNYKSVLNTIFEVALEENIIDRNPIPKPKKSNRKKKSSAKNEREAFSKEEINTLFPKNESDIKLIWNDYQHYAMYLTMLTAGIRPGEVRALKWNDFWADVNVIDINKCINSDKKIGPPKCNQFRSVAIPIETAQVLKQLRALQKWSAMMIIFFRECIEIGLYRKMSFLAILEQHSFDIWELTNHLQKWLIHLGIHITLGSCNIQILTSLNQ